MRKILFCVMICFVASCGSGDVGESYNSTDTTQLNQESKNELNNKTPVNDDSIGGIVEQPYVMGKNSLNTSADSNKNKQ